MILCYSIPLFIREKSRKKIRGKGSLSFFPIFFQKKDGRLFLAYAIYTHMPRPQKERRIGHCAPAVYFKPQGIPLRILESVDLAADELEAVRLADFEGLYQEQAAERMGVSRQTLGLILARAHKKIAEALTQGKAIRLECVSEIIPEQTTPAPLHHGRGNGCRGHHGRGGWRRGPAES